LPARFPAWGCFRKKPGQRKGRGKNGKNLRMVNLDVFAQGAQVDIAWGKLEISVQASHKGWVAACRRGFSLFRKGTVPGNAGAHAGARKIQWETCTTRPAPDVFTYEPIAKIFSDPLRKQLDPVLAPLWISIAPLVPALLQPAGPKAGAKPEAHERAGSTEKLNAWLQKIKWNTTGDGSLEFFVQFGAKNTARSAFSNSGI
jgi:hypothetical protein